MRLLHLPDIVTQKTRCVWGGVGGNKTMETDMSCHIQYVIVTSLTAKGNLKYAGLYSNSDKFGISA